MRKFINYCKESWVELTQKVTWPTWQKLQSSALLVMVATVILAAALFLIDFTFEHLMKLIYSL
jgi:preprotein translocase subunit SecE